MNNYDDLDSKSKNLQQYRCGYVALAGRPNVGKSTLLNSLVGQHLSIVSPRAQTTRERVSGIVTNDDHQILFIDAPGLIEPKYALQEAMRWAADKAIEDSDVVALVADATRCDQTLDESIFNLLQAAGKPALVVINKCDSVEDREIAALVARSFTMSYETVAVSASTGFGLDELQHRLVEMLPHSPALFPADDTAVQSLRFFAEEFVREACFEQFRQEIPFGTICRCDEFREGDDPIFIRVHIYVERESQKGIVIGQGGGAIKAVGQSARKKIERLVDARVFLELRVKVIPRWSRKHGRLRRLGFELPPGVAGGQ